MTAKKRVLFCDDEPHVLSGLKACLYNHRRHWNMRFAVGAEEALRLLEAEPADVIVSDMRMPGIDGAELLSRVREQYPDTVRIVLSGQSDREATARALPVSHQFLGKPCDAGQLEQVVERACNLAALVRDEHVRGLVGSLDALPPLPRVYAELSDLLRTGEASSAAIARVIESDMAICAKLLQIVNSAYFRVARPIATIERAVTYLGVETVRNIALGLGAFAGFHGPATARRSLEGLQRHAFLVAQASKIIAGGETADQAYLSGLLHDIGRLVLFAIFGDDYDEVTQRGFDEGLSLHEAELRAWDTDHGKVGGYLLGLWGLPFPVVEAVAFHHTPRDVPTYEFSLAGVVYCADSLIEAEGEQAARGVDEDFLRSFGLMDRLPVWRERVGDLLGEGNDG